MSNKNFQTFFDFFSSKIRAGVFNINNNKEIFYYESEFFTNQLNLESKIEKIITSLEKDINEYIDSINLMIDSSKTLSIGISISKKFDGSQLKQSNIKFLVQEVKQQILKNYANYNIIHIIINNYKIDGVDYSYLPNEIKCNFLSLDLFFICLPADLVLYFKKVFSNSNILINEIISSSYVKSINYKNNLNLNGHTSFIDIGFNKTSIISYYNDKILSLNTLPIGGNHVTKDISAILNIDLKQAENIKINFDYNQKPDDISIETIQKIILARTEEILKLSIQFCESNSPIFGKFKIVLMGGGSKLIDDQYKNKIFLLNDIDFFEETSESICQSGFKFITELNIQEVVVVPKKQLKQGFFEKLFHSFS